MKRTQVSYRKKRQLALAQLQQTDDPDYAAIAAAVGVSKETIWRWHQLFLRKGPHALLKRKLGRPLKADPRLETARAALVEWLNQLSSWHHYLPNFGRSPAPPAQIYVDGYRGSYFRKLEKPSNDQ